MAFNLFANFEEFSKKNTNDDSFLEGELMDTTDIDLSQKEIKKPPAKSRSRRNQSKRASPKKASPKKTVELECSDDDGTDNEVTPGVGQKTAFKKLDKLKKSLQTNAVVEPARTRSRRANMEINEDYQKMRAKRTRLEDTAQQDRVVELIDMTTPERNPPDSPDIEETNIFLKIKWEGTSKIEKMKFSIYKPFGELVMILSAREKVDLKSLLLMIGNTVIKPSDNPHSIGYTLGKFISVRIVDNVDSFITPNSTSSQSDTIEIKVQRPEWRQPFICNMKLTDEFKVPLGMCAEKLKCGTGQLRFKFEGDILSNEDTPKDFDFEGGEILDLIIDVKVDTGNILK